MSRILMVAAASLALASMPTAVAAQDRWGIELRGGAAFATQDVGETSPATGFGFEGTAAYRIQPHLSVYTGWDWHHFPADNSAGVSTGDFEETGYVLGFLFEHPIGESQTMALQLRAGGTYNHIEVEDDAGDIIADSGHGFGYEAGAGMAFRLAEGWWITPGARFRSLTRDLESGPITTSVDLRYMAVEIGISRRF